MLGRVIELPELFDQLGLPNTDFAITRFIEQHPLPDGVPLVDADFWTERQRRFLRDNIRQGSYWRIAVNDLNELLRH